MTENQKKTKPDPISEFLYAWFEPKVIVAQSHRHGEICARKRGIDPRQQIIIATNSTDYYRRLMGIRVKKENVIIYETAPRGKYYYDVLRELEHIYAY